MSLEMVTSVLLIMHEDLGLILAEGHETRLLSHHPANEEIPDPYEEQDVKHA